MNEIIKYKKNLIFIFLILFASLFVRFHDLNLDPLPYAQYGTSWADEGAYIYNARNKALFGEWSVEGYFWNPMYISPILSYLEFLSFKFMGVSTFSMRMVPAILGVIAILIVFIISIRMNRREGFIYSLLLLTNILLVAYSRTAIVESVPLFFIIIILGFIMIAKKRMWFLIGFFLPFVFFSKSTAFFFVAALPLSFIIHFTIYKSKIILKNFLIFISGSAASLILWSFWLIPRIDSWIFMNFGVYGSRLSVNIILKIVGAFLYMLKFFLINPVSLILSLVLIFFVIKSLKNKQSVEFIDLFLSVSLALFILQIVIVDFPMRRFVLVVPVILFMTSRLLLNFDKANFYLKNKLFKFNKENIVMIVLLVYVIINLTPIVLFFGQATTSYEEFHVFVDNSRVINQYIPPGSNVYEDSGVSLSLENTIRPFSRFGDVNNSELFSTLGKVQIDFALSRVNLFSESDIEKFNVNFNDNIMYKDIKNNFEILKVLNTKDFLTNSLNGQIYLYHRKNNS